MAVSACAAPFPKKVELEVVEAQSCPLFVGQLPTPENCSILVEDESGERRWLDVYTLAGAGDRVRLHCTDRGEHLACRPYGDLIQAAGSGGT